MAVKPNHNQRIRAIWEKTGGHCHFCGDPVKLRKRGYSGERSDGSWEIDHVTQKAKGGQLEIENCLPACTKCNRLRWHRTGAELRQQLGLGIIAWREVKRLTEIGQALIRLEDRLKIHNRLRRKSSSLKKSRATDPVLIEQKRQTQRSILEEYLRHHLRRSFTAKELSRRTGIGKSRIRPLLALSRRARIKTRGRMFVFEGKPSKRGQR